MTTLGLATFYFKLAESVRDCDALGRQLTSFHASNATQLLKLASETPDATGLRRAIVSATHSLTIVINIMTGEG